MNVKTWQEHIAADYPHPFDRPEKEYMQAEIDALRAELDAIAATEPRAYEVYQKCSTKYSTLTYDTSKVPEVFVGGTVNPLFTRPMPPIIGLQDVHDAITSDPTLAESNAEFDESQFKSVEDLIAYLNKLNSYRDKTLEALSKYKGAKGGCITQK